MSFKFTDAAHIVMQERLLLPGESPEDMFKRVATFVAGCEDPKDREYWQDRFYYLMSTCRGLPNTPALANAGNPRVPNQLSACFVVGTKDDMKYITQTLQDSSIIHKSGGGTGMCPSRWREKGATVASYHGIATGPMSFIQGYDNWLGKVSQGQMRPGASMATFNIHHNDIEEFIDSKLEEGSLPNYNISSLITDEFMQCLYNDDRYELRSVVDGRVLRKEKAHKIWDRMVGAAYATGDPGVVFVDTINRNHPIPGTNIDACNPCQPADALVLTQDGISTIGRVEVGDIIWSGSQWTTIINKVSRGTKDVYDYRTGTGFFRGTPNHRVVSNGEKIEVESTKFIDTAFGPVDMNSSHSLLNKNRATSSMIVSRIFVAHEEVFDITVDCATHTYWSGGLLVANCGEQPLMDYEACVLFSLDVSKYINISTGLVDEGQLRSDVITAVRFCDNVIELQDYPDVYWYPGKNGHPGNPIKEAVQMNRKIGIGPMGLSHAFVKKNLLYGSPESIEFAAYIKSFIKNAAADYSSELAKIRGCFGSWHKSIFAKEGVLRRNACLTSVNPDGTRSILANCSSGCEPSFAMAYKRKYYFKDGVKTDTSIDSMLVEHIAPIKEINPITYQYIKDQIIGTGSVQHLGQVPIRTRELFRGALEIPWQEHLAVQAALQNNGVDGAVSKTINLPNNATKADISEVYIKAYEYGLKGVTVYRNNCRSAEHQQFQIGTADVRCTSCQE